MLHNFYLYDQAELDKEVGKRDFLFDIITYPYAGTINFKICFDVNQDRIPKFEWLTNSLTQSGRFRTSGSTFGSRSTGCRFLEEQGRAREAGRLVRTMNLRFRVQNLVFLVVYWSFCQKMLKNLCFFDVF